MGENAVMVRQQSGLAVQAPLDPDALVKRAQLVIDAGLAPESYVKDAKGAQKLALIAMRGMDAGMSFMEAINSYYVVKGRIGEMTHQLVLGLREHGHDYVIAESTPERCTVTFYGADGRSRPPFTLSFEDCEKAGWTRESGGGAKPLWAHPTGRTIMLRYRTISNGIRAYFPEVVHAAKTPLAVPQVGVSAPDDDGAEFVDTETGEIIEGHVTALPTQPAAPENPPQAAAPIVTAPHWSVYPANRTRFSELKAKLTLSNDEMWAALRAACGVEVQKVSDFPGSVDDACRALNDYVARKAGGASAGDQLAGAW